MKQILRSHWLALAGACFLVALMCLVSYPPVLFAGHVPTAVLGTPLRIAAFAVLGILFLWQVYQRKVQENTLREHEEKLSQVFLERGLQWQTAEGLAGLGKRLTTAHSSAEVAQQISESLAGILDPQAVVLFALDPSANGLRALAMLGNLGPLQIPDLLLPAGMGVAGYAIEARQPITTLDFLTDQRFTWPPALRAGLEQSPCRAILAVPLLLQDRVVGALSISDLEGRVFRTAEVRLVQTFAQHAALALDNAHLHRERRVTAMLGELARALYASHDRETIVQQALAYAQELCHADVAWLALRHMPSATLVARYWRGWHRQPDRDVALDSNQGVGDMAWRTGMPQSVHDITSSPSPGFTAPELAHAEGLMAELAVPVCSEQTVIGLLLVGHRAPHHFTTQEIAHLSQVAPYVALAVQQTIGDSAVRQNLWQEWSATMAALSEERDADAAPSTIDVSSAFRASESPVWQSHEAGQTPRILIVDEDAATRRTLQTLLQGAGFDTMAVASGPQALRTLAQASDTSQPFALVFLHTALPSMSGWAVVAQLRRDATLAHTPVVMLTAARHGKDMEQCDVLGLRYLSKPFRPADLRDVLEAVFAPAHPVHS